MLDYLRCTGMRCKRDRNVIECILQIGGFSHVFRRNRDADDAQTLLAAVDDGDQRVAGTQCIGSGKGFAGQYLACVACLYHPPATDIDAVELAVGRCGKRYQACAGRFVQAAHIQRRIEHHASFDRIDAGNVPYPLQQRDRSAAQIAKYIGKPVLRIVVGLCGQQRFIRAAHRDEGGDTAHRHQRNRHSLAAHAPQVAHQLAVERAQAYHAMSSGDRRAALRSIRVICPLPIYTTRSAMPAIAALWVMMTMVVPSSRFTRCSTCSTILPVLKSSAPVGSSHNNTSGRFATARAIATRCCSPPDSCAGKWCSIHRIDADFRHQLDVFQRSQARDQIVELEHEAHMLAPEGSQCRFVGAGQVVVQIVQSAGSRRIETAQNVQQSGFAAAGSSQQHDEFARMQFKIDMPERLDLHFAHRVYLAHIAQRKYRRPELRCDGRCLIPGYIIRCRVHGILGSLKTLISVEK